MDDNGSQVSTLATFTYNGTRGSKRFMCSLQPGFKLAIVATQTSRPVLLSA